MADDGAEEAGASKQRSPAFPYIALDIAIERVKLIHSKVKDFPQNREQIAKAYGKPATSSATIQTIATLQQYGLLEVVIANGERRLRVTQLARKIVHPNAPWEQRESGLKTAALLPIIFKELWERYKDLKDLSDDVPLYYLTFDREAEGLAAFTESAAKDVLRVYRSTLVFAGIKASDNTGDGENAVDEWEAAAPSVPPTELQEGALATQAVDAMQSSPRQPTPMVSPVGLRSDTCNIPEGIVTLSFPDEFSEASLEDIEAWLDFQKNRLKRWVKAN